MLGLGHTIPGRGPARVAPTFYSLNEGEGVSHEISKQSSNYHWLC
jgi:hypothetical protein